MENRSVPAEPARSRVQGLALLRVSLGLFLAFWGLDKIVAPEGTVGIYSHFYFLTITPAVAQALGVLEILLGMAYAGGLLRTWTYGAGFALHALSTLSTWKQLIDPWGYLFRHDQNFHLFWAAVPVLAAFWAVFANRHADTCWSLDEKWRPSKNP